jgi:hypothetical protein
VVKGKKTDVLIIEAHFVSNGVVEYESYLLGAISTFYNPFSAKQTGQKWREIDMVEMVGASMHEVVNKMEKVTCIHRSVVREHCASYVSVMSDENYWRSGT